ncbi:hypothetical protein DRO27_02270 [Candidatus Bathyarchaeota archaeon]|nr:MAG: hypothetical protein DRO27_02270 [Candidatus Bathyarchaeota archaeon]
MVLWWYQSALMYGAVIGLLALGFRLTHEVSGYMNLGHVVNLGVGMMLGFLVIQQTNITPILGVPFSFIFMGGLNALVYLLFYRRMESKRYPEALIALFGLVSSFLWVSILKVTSFWLNLRFESEYWCNPGPISENNFFVNHLHYRTPGFWGFAGGFIEVMLLFASIIFVSYWVYRNGMSVKFRAIAENMSLLEICGVNSSNVKTIAWFIAGGLGGVAGVMAPFALNGEFGGDIEGYFVPVILASVIIGKRESWLAGIAGLVVGFVHRVIINSGVVTLGIWFAEYWNIINVVFLAIVLYMKDRRLKLPSWVYRRPWS